MTTRACMGGWCARREHCHNYHTDQGRDRAVERLCLPGQDGVTNDFTVVIRKPAGSWEQAKTKEAA